MDPLTLRHEERLVCEYLQRAVCGHLSPDAGGVMPGYVTSGFA